jgi:hypothetical protein
LIYARIDHSGYGTLKSTSRKISEPMEAAASIILLGYHKRMGMINLSMTMRE